MSLKGYNRVFDKGDAITYSKAVYVYVISKILKNRYELIDTKTGDVKSRLYKEELKPVEEIAGEPESQEQPREEQ